VNYELQEHVGDAKIHSSGDNLGEAFTGVARAFAEVCGTETSTGDHAHTIEVESEGLNPLLYDFLDRLIYLQDVDLVAVTDLHEVDVEDLEAGWRLDADVEVKSLDRAMNLRDVKAPTYSEMQTEFEDGKWQLSAVLDL
jgi:Uncharacterized conserved protein